MDKKENNIKIKNRGLIYFIKKLLKCLPFKTNIRTGSSECDVEIRISMRKMEKMVDNICSDAVYRADGKTI